MLQRIRNARRDESGFTLIELLIVIVILGVLSGVVVFSVRAISDRGTVSACKADVSTVNVASEAHYAKNAAYAASIDALVKAGYLQRAPSTTNGYTVTYAAATGRASSTVCP